MKENGSIVTTTHLWSCAADGCGKVGIVERCNSVLATLDHRYAVAREGLPDDWQEIRGQAFCPDHDVEVTAMVRTPTLARVGRGFVGGFAEELVILQRSHIGDAVDALYERATKAAQRPGENCTMAQGTVGDERAPIRRRA